MTASKVNMRHRKLLLPKGVAKSTDTTFVSTGDVYNVDPVAATATVNVRGGVVTLPCVADRYSGNSLARVLHDPFSGRPVSVLGAVFPDAPYRTFTVAEVDTGSINVTALPGVLPGGTFQVPAPAGTYTVGGTAFCLTDEWGNPAYALYNASAAVVVQPPPPPKPKPSTQSTVTATARIVPSWSGTYRESYSKWDDWNQYRYGGSSDIYQGDAYGSGPLDGLAIYGSAVHNLGAVSIQKITLHAYKNDDGLSATLQVQGAGYSTHPSGAPSSSGDIVSASIGPGSWGTLTFTAAMCESFRTGAFKSLCAVGSQYGGFGGTGHSGSFVLTVYYTKNA